MQATEHVEMLSPRVARGRWRLGQTINTVTWPEDGVEDVESISG